MRTRVGSGQRWEAVARRAWRCIDERTARLSICLTHRKELRALNARYRGKPKGTDVLTFPYVMDGVLWGGDIVIGIEQARRQAGSRRVSVADECHRLIVHGLCHLAGYRHDSLPAFSVMRQIEFETLICLLSR